MVKGKQISVFLDDKPGTLANVAAVLGSHHINIYALSLAEGIGHGYVRLVVNKHDEARQILHDAGELVMERDVLLLELSNQPGSLGVIAQVLSEKGINLDYAYCAGGPSVDKGLIVIKVDDTDKALEVLSTTH
ncbi:MAG TPA: amino acid-binding protein [Verrucomicrobia bacterium]|nr:amino acid-binding protein [Verrucomicrobiota bacterium]